MEEFENDGTCAVLIVDCNLNWWTEQTEWLQTTHNLSAKADKGSVAAASRKYLASFSKQSSAEFSKVVTALWGYICSFVNAYLASNSANQVVILACFGRSAYYLYPRDDLPLPSEMLANTSKPNRFAHIYACVQLALRKISNDLTPQEALLSNEVSFAGAMATGMGYFNRLCLERGEDLKCRFIILSCGAEDQSQYLNFINSVFAAQKLNCAIDCLIMDKERHSNMLQQAADLTGGIYSRLENLVDIETVLFTAFLVDKDQRDEEAAVLRRFVPIDYRATCVCHKKLIETGVVCSVCLTAFCDFQPFCPTCGTVLENILDKNNKSDAKKKEQVNGFRVK